LAQDRNLRPLAALDAIVRTSTTSMRALPTALCVLTAILVAVVLALVA
jgi:hypothetical protein